VRIRDERISNGPDGTSDLTEPPRKERAGQPWAKPGHDTRGHRTLQIYAQRGVMKKRVV
jgi:hypothetical protein